MLKRIIALTISGILTFLLIASAENIQNSFHVEIEFLKQIGILDNAFKSEGEITKSHLTALLLKTIHPDDIFSESGWMRERLFRDVDTDHPYYPYLKACKDLGIINGDGEGYFYPDQTLTLNEALAMIINALGYTPYAMAYGGYPSGYYKAAKDAGILKGITVNGAESISGGLGAKLIYNTLFADVMSIERIANGETLVRPQRDSSILTERFGITEYNAIVADNGITSLVGNNPLDPEWVILKTPEDKIISVYGNNTGIEGHLGSMVRVFVKNNEETGRNEVIGFDLHVNNKEMIINSDLIVRVTDHSIEYETDKSSGRVSTLNFESNGPIVIYNGVHMAGYESEHLKPESGLLRLVDNDGNGRYNLIDVLSFKNPNNKAWNIVVDSADLEKGFIYCKFNPAQMNLNLEPDKVYYRFLYQEGITGLEGLKPNDIVSVAESEKLIGGKRVYLLVARRNQVNAVIEGVNAEAGTILLNGKEYKISSSILKTKGNFVDRLGFLEEITFFLDGAGNIAYALGYQSKGKNYGYLIRAIQTGLGDAALARIFTIEGEIKQFNLSGKTMIDGVLRNGAEEQLQGLIRRPSALKKPDEAPADSEYMSRPIIYETNAEGYIVKIDTDYPNEATEDSEALSSPHSFKGNVYSGQTNIGYTEDEINKSDALKAAYRSARLAVINGGNIDNMFYLTGDTLIMCVPDIDANGLGDAGDIKKILSDKQSGSYQSAVSYGLIKKYEYPIEDKNYKILTLGQLKGNVNYDIQAYDIDPDTGVAGLAVIRGRTDGLAYGKVPATEEYPMYAFLRINEIYDPVSEKNMYKLYYTQYGNDEIFALADKENLHFIYDAIIFGCNNSDTPFNIPVSALKCGDLIRVFKSGDYLTHLERVYRVDDVLTTYSSMYYPGINSNAYSATGVTGFPYDVRNLWAPHTDDGYRIRTIYPKNITENKLTAYMGFPSPLAIDFTDKTTYSILYYDISEAQIILMNRDAGGAIKVSKGEISDIVTTDRVNELDDASILMCRSQNGLLRQIFVLN